jgi:hypothetical protein
MAEGKLLHWVAALSVAALSAVAVAVAAGFRTCSIL